jgi:hypothetical protein
VAAIEKLFELNEKYGTPDCNMHIEWELIWSRRVNDFDRLLDCLEELYENSWGSMPYIGTNLFKHDQLKNYPRYIELLKKMNLPSP